MPLALSIPLAIASIFGLAYALVHDANTRRRAREQVPQTPRPVQQWPARDTQSVLDQPWWENA